ncbi:MAG: hypothetical protein ABI921_02140, partial [Panacibacter sp.]
MKHFLKCNTGFGIAFVTFVLLPFAACEKSFKPISVAENNQAVNLLAANKPNIVFIVGDDIGYEIPGSSGAMRPSAASSLEVVG